MKRTGYLKERVVSLDNLYVAYNKACKGKYWKQEVLDFSAKLDDNIRMLREKLIDGSLNFGNYHYFTIRDPKERTICAASFSERIIHHAIINICQPYFDKTLIDTTYATRKGKGVYAALEKAKEALSDYPYTVKLDFRKYYDSIDHCVLKHRLSRLFKDFWLINLFDKIIDSFEKEPGKGLPIGNLTSQYFANNYLSIIDHKAKEQWGVPVYIRYMDDILMAGKDKGSLIDAVKEMTDFSYRELRLTLKPPVYRKSKDGQTFLGYKVLPYRIQLSGRSKRRFRTKLLEYGKLVDNGTWTESTYQERILPLLAFVQHAESRTFRRACLQIHTCKGDNQIVASTV
ncbi:MAG: hypothetical protein IJ748_05075 [Bacteroidales bacterium]|nr:hypothetical protein [Bacteroidales bacterium]